MIKNIFLDKKDERYYIPLFEVNNQTFFVEISKQDYESENAPWTPGTMHKINFNFLKKRLIVSGTYDVPEDQIAQYMLLVIA